MDSKPPKRDQRTRKLETARANAATGMEIGAIPPVKDPERKAACGESFKLFCATYFPNRYYFGWSRDHDIIIAKVEAAARTGGQFALAMPRGSGKTTLCETAAMWALLYGYRKWAFIVGATDDAAKKNADNIKFEFETNTTLAEDFPEVCFPVHALDGVPQRANGQTVGGERTRMHWGSRGELALPLVKGSVASCGLITVAGLTGHVRGGVRTLPNGMRVRPDFVLLDDPQTAESAWSAQQCIARARIIARDVDRLAGPGVKLTAVMPCTVIRRGDLADELLDSEKHPEWRGERTKMLYAFPDALKRWEGEYNKLRENDLRQHGRLVESTAFYIANRAEMDAGAEVAWPDNHEDDEASGIQHAMNLWLKDPAAFAAEMQNEPETDEAQSEELTPDDVLKKLNGLKRGVVPAAATVLTAHYDVHDSLIYYAVMAWSPSRVGWIVDYGTWPRQPAAYFVMSRATDTLADTYPGASLEGRLSQGFSDLSASILGAPWRREDGAEMRVQRLLIDANWGLSTDTVYDWCRTGEFSNIAMPAHGKYIGPAQNPMGEWRRKPGERHGDNWVIPCASAKRRIRHVLFDANHWKSQVHRWMARLIGDVPTLTIYGDDPERHRMLAEQFCSEFSTAPEYKGRKIEEWKLKPSKPDSHLRDNIVGAAVAASIEGINAPALRVVKPTRKRKLSELQREKMRAIGR